MATDQIVSAEMQRLRRPRISHGAPNSHRSAALPGRMEGWKVNLSEIIRQALTVYFKQHKGEE